VLDVGLGRGVQALRLARAGHEVTGLESDPDLRELFEKQVAAEPDGIRQRVRLVEGGSEDTGAHFLPGTFDVVLCHGGLVQARDPGRAGDWDAALAAFDFPEHAGSAFRLETVTRGLAGIGTPLRQWYGVGIFGHTTFPADDEEAERMLAVEGRAARTDPYRSVAAMLHVCGARGG
jgi:SAM-dependent methyltransferase